MDPKEIFKKVDELYETNRASEVEPYLLKQLNQATKQEDYGCMLSIMNELIGLYRSRSLHQESIAMSMKAIELLAQLGMVNTIGGATTLLNSATAFKMAHELTQAKILYERCLEIYQISLEETDYRYISLYNNMSDMYRLMDEDQQALNYLDRALSLLDKQQYPIEYATSLVNKAYLYFKMKEKDKAINTALKANALFKHYPDPHQGTCLVLLGELLENRDYFEEGIYTIKKNYGRNEEFEESLRRYRYLLEKQQEWDLVDALKREENHQFLSGMELSKLYYQYYGKPYIESHFPNEKITIGLFGMGSECFNMDDAVSQDHDFYPRFMMLIEEKDQERLEKKLQSFYDELPTYFLGYGKEEGLYREKREGVFIVEHYFESLFGQHYLLNEPLDWFYMDVTQLSMIQNGELFEEDKTKFSYLRESLKSFPEDVRIKKIMTSLSKMAQYGQYNYQRMRCRQDHVTASLCLNNFIDEALKLVYLLEKEYYPYYKWRYLLAKKKELQLSLLQDIETLVDLKMNDKDYQGNVAMVNKKDPIVLKIESIAGKVVMCLKEQGLTKGDELFLQAHLEYLREHIQDETIKQMHVMEG